MKFIDANVFLRLVTTPVTDNDIHSLRRCLIFFQRLEAGEFEATTSEVVIHEVFHILCSTRNYGLAHPDAAERMMPVLSLRLLHVPQRRLVMRAVELFRDYSFLDFSDALSIAYCEAEGHDLISFDRDIDRVSVANRSEP